jgi:lipoprotein-anchoring transpeptidase ErfK/SrfK
MSSVSKKAFLAAAAAIAVSTGTAVAAPATPWVVPANAPAATAVPRGTSDAMQTVAVPPGAPAETTAAAPRADPTVDPGADPVNTSLATYVVPEAPPPQLLAQVDLSDQTMTVYLDDQVKYVFRVSTGRMGFGTPTGEWNAQWLSRFHRSKKYHYAPMPWSVFFHGGYAVHGTTEVRNLGRPASHGCVHLHPDNAKIFYQLVQTAGKENSRVTIVR